MTLANETDKSAWDKISRHPAMLLAGRIARRVGYRVFRLSGELVAVVFGLGIAWLYAMSWLLTQQSVDLEFMQPWAEQGFAQAFEGHDAKIDSMRLNWLPTRNRISYEAENISVKDEDEAVLQTFPALQVDFAFEDAKSLLFRPKYIALEGGTVTALTNEDGTIVVGLGTPETVGRFGPVFRGEVQSKSPQISVNDFEGVSLRNSQLFVEDKLREMSLHAAITALQLTQSSEDYSLNLTGSLAQALESAPIKLSARADKELQKFDLSVQAEGVRLDELGPRAGRFRDLRRIAAPIRLNVEVDFDRSAGLQFSDIDIGLGRGIVDTPNRTLNLESFAFVAKLNPGDDILNVEKIDIVARKFDFRGQGDFTKLGALNDGDPASSPLFDLTFKRVNINATPIFETPFALSQVDLRGQMDFDARHLIVDQLTITNGDYKVDLNADALFGERAISSVKVNGDVTGVFLPTDLTAIWPVAFADGARSWISRSAIGGQITPVKYKIDLGPDFFERPALTPDRIQLDFGISNGDVRYISTMPPARGVTATGRISGNSLTMNFEGGTVQNLSLGKGKVQIPQLMPKGGDLIVSVDGSGAASDMMALVNHKPFEFADSYGIDPGKIGGQGDISVNITRPLLVHFDQNRIKYSVTGEFRDAISPFQIGPHKIHNGNVKLAADRQGVHLDGPAQIGPWPVNIAWHEYLGTDTRPTHYEVTGRMDYTILDNLGVGLRQYFDGDVGVTINAFGPADPIDQAKAKGLSIENGTAEVDFTQAELSFKQLWSKPRGVPGMFRTDLSYVPDQAVKLSNITAKAEGLSLAGSLDIGPDLRLIALDLKTIRLDGLIDAALQLKPDTERQRFSMFLDGYYFNATPFTQFSLNKQGSATEIPVLLTASLKNLQLRENYTVSDARILLNHTGENIQDFRLAGRTEDGAVVAEIVSETDTGDRLLTLSVPEASRVAKSFLGLESTQGGQLELRAKLPPIGSEAPIVGQVIMEEFKLQQTPFLGQILSLASLTGMGDMLSGDGLRFKRFVAPFTMTDSAMKIRGARLYGPVLGMTGDGDIDLDNRLLDIDGTLVPAYSANSILEDIPLLGDILSSEKGGGVFALNYSVKGSFDKTQISVNPLSALTPGFLRGIFSPKREGLSDEVMAEIEAVMPEDPGE